MYQVSYFIHQRVHSVDSFRILTMSAMNLDIVGDHQRMSHVRYNTQETPTSIASKPAMIALLTEAAKAPLNSSMSSRDISFGFACASFHAMADGAHTLSGHPPLSFPATPPGLSQGARVLAYVNNAYESASVPQCHIRICSYLTTRMTKLDHDILVLGMGELNDLSERLDLAVLP